MIRRGPEDKVTLTEINKIYSDLGTLLLGGDNERESGRKQNHPKKRHKESK
jgi:hypothetical protein